jgi:hypothetical protein
MVGWTVHEGRQNACRSSAARIRRVTLALPTVEQVRQLGCGRATLRQDAEDPRECALVWKALSRFPEGHRGVGTTDGGGQAKLLANETLSKLLETVGEVRLGTKVRTHCVDHVCSTHGEGRCYGRPRGFFIATLALDELDIATLNRLPADRLRNSGTPEDEHLWTAGFAHAIRRPIRGFQAAFVDAVVPSAQVCGVPGVLRATLAVTGVTVSGAGRRLNPVGQRGSKVDSRAHSARRPRQ